MIISYSSVPEALTTTVGYGVAGFGVVRSLQKLGHKVPYQDATAPVELCWSNAEQWNWSNEQGNHYRIGYSTWEAHSIPSHWKEQFDSVDEVWTTTPVMASWYEQVAQRPVKAYEHGIDGTIWQPRRRSMYKNVIRFLHDGVPSDRKQGQQAVDAFRAAFGNRRDVHLTLKCLGMNNTRVLGNKFPEKVYENVSADLSVYPSTDDVASLYARHHVLVCNSEAEGFGLPGLQGIASGMVTMCNPGWASYSRFILPDLRIKSHFGPAVNQHVVPGKAFPTDFDDLVDKYRYVANNIERLIQQSYEMAPKAIEAYDWLKLTENAFRPVAERFGNEVVTSSNGSASAV